MAYLAAANVTVTLAQKDIVPLGMSKKMVFPSIAYGNGVLQYPALGIPMPAISYFGLKRAIERAFIEQPANGYIYHFDRTNHKLRIFLGAAQAAITVENHVGVAPTGNLANLVAGAFTGDALANITPAGNLANLVAAAHSHDLVNAANTETYDVAIGVHEANTTLAGNIANAVTIPGGNATLGGVANATPGNSSGDFVGDPVAPGTPTGNVANGTGDFVGDAMAPGTPTGNVTADFVGDAPANLTHTVTGGGAVAEAALAEMDDGVAPAATTLYMQMVGR